MVIPLVFAVIASQPALEGDCTHWRGTVSGNDPSVSVTATLCRVGKDTVRGVLIWTSDLSGTNIRTIEGKQTAGGLVLHDVALRGSPKPGWRFCSIDRYTLRTDGDHLSGSYHSSACSDDATVKLARAR